MPRKYARRKRRRQSTFQKVRNVASTAYKAYRVAKWVKSLVNVEKKFLDSTLDTNVDTTGNVKHLNAIGAGTGYNARTGNSIKAYSLNVAGTIRPNATTPT